MLVDEEHSKIKSDAQLLMGCVSRISFVYVLKKFNALEDQIARFEACDDLDSNLEIMLSMTIELIKHISALEALCDLSIELSNFAYASIDEENGAILSGDVMSEMEPYLEDDDDKITDKLNSIYNKWIVPYDNVEVFIIS